MKLIYAFVLVATFALSSVSTSRILFLFPSPSKSHLIAAQGLASALVEHDHDVTVVSPFPLGKQTKNYRVIKSPLSEEAANFADEFVKNQKESMLTRFPKIVRLTENVGRDMMDMPEFKRIMKEEKFDLVVIGMFMNNYLIGVGKHFNCPTIMLSAAGAMSFTNLLFANPMEVAAVPHMMAFKSGRMDFLDRMKSFAAYGFDLAMNYYLNHLQRRIYK